MEKIKCCICNKKEAVWFYMPGSSKGNNFFCDDCVPRGCSCHVYHINEFSPEEFDRPIIFWDEKMEKFTTERTPNSTYWERVDEQGRRYPCCEFDYDKDGYNEDLD